ncbi:Imm50 family immunity protein [Lentzea sp. BCCO 10_0856]|uniref:Imm50 family immunity protein n=1 Tax=Lentzea miocenica TaxID=3095431 RepID=A0ABU4SY17_9PSEU|nr:Imm50 family immunity protein [Lentzea sp. BCCO 10_0856]MDX8030813.1 Imm50 family immunity protein [Lentzea sp. BCCO 10_0856]
MSWLDHLALPGPGRRAVDELYSTPPSLAGADLHEVVVSRDSPSVALRFNLAEFADRPRQEWVAAGMNRVQVRLRFDFVEDLVIRGFGFTNDVSIDMDLVDDEKLAVHVHGPTTDITFRCWREPMLSKISAYIHNPNSI